MQFKDLSFYFFEAFYRQVNKKFVNSIEKGLFKYQIESRNFVLNNKFLNHSKSMKLVGQVNALRRSFGFNDIEVSSSNGAKTYLKYPTQLYKYIFNKKKRLPLIEVGILKRSFKNLFFKSANLLYHSIHNMPFRNVYLHARLGLFETQPYILRIKNLNRLWIFSLLHSNASLSLKSPLFIQKKRYRKTRPTFILLGFKFQLKTRNLLSSPVLFQRSKIKAIGNTPWRRKPRRKQKKRAKWTPLVQNLITDSKEREGKRYGSWWYPFLKNSPEYHDLHILLPAPKTSVYKKRAGLLDYQVDALEYLTKVTYTFNITNRLLRRKRRGKSRKYKYLKYIYKKKIKRFDWRYRKYFYFPFRSITRRLTRNIKRLSPRFKAFTLKRSNILFKYTLIRPSRIRYQQVLSLDLRPHDHNKNQKFEIKKNMKINKLKRKIKIRKLKRKIKIRKLKRKIKKNMKINKLKRKINKLRRKIKKLKRKKNMESKEYEIKKNMKINKLKRKIKINKLKRKIKIRKLKRKIKKNMKINKLKRKINKLKRKKNKEFKKYKMLYSMPAEKRLKIQKNYEFKERPEMYNLAKRFQVYPLSQRLLPYTHYYDKLAKPFRQGRFKLIKHIIRQSDFPYGFPPTRLSKKDYRFKVGGLFFAPETVPIRSARKLVKKLTAKYVNRFFLPFVSAKIRKRITKFKRSQRPKEVGKEKKMIKQITRYTNFSSLFKI